MADNVGNENMENQPIANERYNGMHILSPLDHQNANKSTSASDDGKDTNDGEYINYPVNAGPDRKTMFALALVISSFFIALIVVVLIRLLVPYEGTTSDGYPALGPEAVANTSNEESH